MTPKRFKQLRTRLGLSQGKLAKRLNMHITTISKYERGVDPIPITVAYAILWLDSQDA